KEKSNKMKKPTADELNQSGILAVMAHINVAKALDPVEFFDWLILHVTGSTLASCPDDYWAACLDVACETESETGHKCNGCAMRAEVWKIMDAIRSKAKAMSHPVPADVI